MNLLEDTLESVLKDDSFATLALVSTGENFREWIYYAKSETEFEARFDYALDGMPPFPIEIHIASDSSDLHGALLRQQWRSRPFVVGLESLTFPVAAQCRQ